MKIYLDCCCLQRPFDDKSQPRIAVEAESVLVILSLCESGRLTLISSEALLFEIHHIPDLNRKDGALEILSMASKTISLTEEVEIAAKKFKKAGLKPLDALHLAFASSWQIDYFCTCDDKFLKKAKSFKKLNTYVVSPTELVMELQL